MTVVECQVRAQEVYAALLVEGLEPDDIILRLPEIRVTKGCTGTTHARVVTHDVRLQVLRLSLVDIYGEGDEADRFYTEARGLVDAMPF